MGIFVDNLYNLRVFHVFEVLQSLLIGLFTEVVHDDHFKIILFISKVNEVLDPAMRLHDQIDQFFVDNV